MTAILTPLESAIFFAKGEALMRSPASKDTGAAATAGAGVACDAAAMDWLS